MLVNDVEEVGCSSNDLDTLVRGVEQPLLRVAVRYCYVPMGRF